MLALTQDATLVCLHEMGKVAIAPTQDLVTIEERFILVEPDVEQRAIKGCPNFAIMIRPCQTTLKAKEGYSPLMTIEGRRVCLDTVRGLTDGTPPGVVEYKVRNAGQDLVDERP
ncbi:MAG: hypothetical protein KIT09_23620 [Bryobacteraceae bacterium]|nr:hypothetical protein [Bryobacteraceae bacterium]